VKRRIGWVVGALAVAVTAWLLVPVRSAPDSALPVPVAPEWPGAAPTVPAAGVEIVLDADRLMALELAQWSPGEPAPEDVDDG
jgi:hypothetical protein